MDKKILKYKEEFNNQFDIVNLHCTLDYYNKEFGNDVDILIDILKNKHEINISEWILNKPYIYQHNKSIEISIYLDSLYDRDSILTYNKDYVQKIITNKEINLLPLIFDEHATVVLYQKIDTNIIDFKIFNSGKGINYHDKDIDTKKYKPYFNIVFDISDYLQKKYFEKLVNIINILNIIPIDKNRITDIKNIENPGFFEKINIYDDNYNGLYELLRKIKRNVKQKNINNIELININNGNNDKIFQKILLNFVNKDNNIFINPQKVVLVLSIH